MLLVIFGAGASYDSVSEQLNGLADESDLLRPPLAKDLFSEKFGRFAAEVPLSTAVVAQMRLASLSGGDVERRLQELQLETDEYPERVYHVAAVQFYLQRLLAAATTHWLGEASGITNYVLLLDTIIKWQRQTDEPVLLVSFNYDTLLEDALERLLPDWSSAPEGVMRRDDIRLLKPHGSIAWARRASLGNLHQASAEVLQDQMCKRFREIDFSDEFAYRRDPLLFSTGNVSESHPLLYPAIAIPVERKAQFQCPQEHIEAIEDLVVQTTRLLVVGWRATEQHFTSLLQRFMPKNRRVHMHVVAENRDATSLTERNLQDALTGVSLVATRYQSTEGFSRFAESATALMPFLTEPLLDRL